MSQNCYPRPWAQTPAARTHVLPSITSTVPPPNPLDKNPESSILSAFSSHRTTPSGVSSCQHQTALDPWTWEILRKGCSKQWLLDSWAARTSSHRSCIVHAYGEEDVWVSQTHDKQLTVLLRACNKPICSTRQRFPPPGPHCCDCLTFSNCRC